MAERSWYVAVAGKQEGPYSETQFRGMIAAGQVTAQTLVWSEGMSAWQRTGDIPGLMAAGQAPPPMQLPGASSSPEVNAGSAVTADFGVWALLGRSLLAALGVAFVIPAPWAMTSFYRWFIAHLRVPQISALGFTGQPGDIWWVFVATALCGYAGAAQNHGHGVHYLPILLIPIEAALAWLVLRWVVANISYDGHALSLRFNGTVWHYIGWMLLLYVSFITIIGWAWVTTAWTRWICRNIEGAPGTVLFAAKGWQVLWRTLAFVLGCVFIIPIPWVLHWFVRWYVSQFSLAAKAA
jgi:hypothetical protein